MDLGYRFFRVCLLLLLFLEVLVCSCICSCKTLLIFSFFLSFFVENLQLIWKKANCEIWLVDCNFCGGKRCNSTRLNPQRYLFFPEFIFLGSLSLASFLFSFFLIRLLCWNVNNKNEKFCTCESEISPKTHPFMQERLSCKIKNVKVLWLLVTSKSLVIITGTEGWIFPNVSAQKASEPATKPPHTQKTVQLILYLPLCT